MFKSLYKFFLKDKYYLETIYNKNIYLFANNIAWDEVFNIIYIFFFFIIVISSMGVLLSKNPIHSVFFLIIVFLHISFLLLLLHVEFLAFLIFIVYLGAIAVLFLFVIMMFNIHILETRDNIIRYIPLVISIFLIIFEISYLTNWIEFKWSLLSFQDFFYIHRNWYNFLYGKDNIVVISIIYSYYLYNFILASLILLVAMIGAIVLTLNLNVDLKKQIYYIQNSKNLYNSVTLKNYSKYKVDIWGIYMKEERIDQEWLKRKYRSDTISNMYTYEHNAFMKSLKDKQAGIIENKIKKY
jgi:NADH-quinone oxidoreductase subunit J